MDLDKKDFNALRTYIRRVCGIDLGDDKEYLVRQRLEPIVTSQGCRGFGEFARIVSCCPTEQLRDQVIAAITTNETSFFRDSHPFDVFRATVLPDLEKLARERKNRVYDRRGAKVSILSAGSSTGQEPYTLSILIHEFCQFGAHGDLKPDDFAIVATDVSSRVLAKAVAGEYSDLEIGRGLSDIQKSLYFSKEGDTWIVNENIRKIVEFRKVNFIEPFTHLGGFDVVFCRNVLIYFDIEMKRRILSQFHQMLSPQGFLVLGATENIYGMSDRFNSNHVSGSVLYRPMAGAAASVGSPVGAAA